MRREFPCPHCGWTVDSTKRDVVCPRCRLELPQVEVEIPHVESQPAITAPVDYFQRRREEEDERPEPPGLPWYSAPWFVILLSSVLALLLLGIALWIAFGGVATLSP